MTSDPYDEQAYLAQADRMKQSSDDELLHYLAHTQSRLAFRGAIRVLFQRMVRDRSLAERSLRVLQDRLPSLEDEWLVYGYSGLGRIHCALEDFDQSVIAYELGVEEVDRLLDQVKDHKRTVHALRLKRRLLGGMAYSAMQQEQPKRDPEQILRQELDLCRSRLETFGPLNNLIELLMFQDRFAEALDYATEALAIVRDYHFDERGEAQFRANQLVLPPYAGLEEQQLPGSPGNALGEAYLYRAACYTGVRDYQRALVDLVHAERHFDQPVKHVDRLSAYCRQRLWEGDGRYRVDLSRLVATHGDCAKMSQDVYRLGSGSARVNLLDSGLRDWKVRSTSRELSDRQGFYFGAAYFNDQAQEIVIAHRGTDSPDELAHNVTAIMRDRSTEELGHAVKFARHVRQLRDREYTNYRIVHTGHSMGAYYGEIVAYNADEHAVTFDSPGSRQYILDRTVPQAANEQPQLEKKRAEKIVQYLAAPNLVNTSGEHVGGRQYRMGDDYPAEIIGPTKSKESAPKGVWGKAKAMAWAPFAAAYEGWSGVTPPSVSDVRWTARLHAMKNFTELFRAEQESGGPLLRRRIRLWPDRPVTYQDYQRLRAQFPGNASFAEFEDEELGRVLGRYVVETNFNPHRFHKGRALSSVAQACLYKDNPCGLAAYFYEQTLRLEGEMVEIRGPWTEDEVAAYLEKKAEANAISKS